MSELMVCHFDGPQPYDSDSTGDYTGHLGQVATEVGSPSFRAGKFGKGLDVSPGNYISYDSMLEEEAGAVLFWFSPDDLFSGAARYIIHDNADKLAIRTYASGWSVTLGDWTAVVSGDPVVVGGWYHFALVWDESACYVYVNGALIFSGLKTTWGVGSDIRIGEGVSGADGVVDELIICNHAPSANAIRSYYNDGVLRLVGENESINLLDPDGLYLARGGWRPQVATADDFGDYTDVDESIELTWNRSSDDLRAPDMQTLQRIYANARRRDPRNDPNSFVPAYVEVRHHSESEIRYAVVRDGTVKELATRHWAAAGPVDVRTTLTREGAWRAVVPRANGVPWPVVTAETYYNKDDADGNNEITILAEDVPGDANALMDFDLYRNSGIRDGMIAMRIGDIDYLDAFQSHFNAADLFSPTGGSLNTNTSAPGEKEYVYTAGTGKGAVWLVDGANMHGYIGNFSAYMLGFTSAVHDDTEFEIYWEQDNEHGNTSTIPVQGSAFYVPYLFNHVLGLPVRATVPGIATSTSNNMLRVNIDIGGSETVTLWSVTLIPIDAGVFGWSTGGEYWSNYADISGRLGISYSYEVVSSVKYAYKALQTFGNYPTLTPNNNTRLYLYQFWTGNGDQEIRPDSSGTVTVAIVPRYLALRGVS